MKNAGLAFIGRLTNGESRDDYIKFREDENKNLKRNINDFRKMRDRKEITDDEYNKLIRSTYDQINSYKSDIKYAKENGMTYKLRDAGKYAAWNLDSNNYASHSQLELLGLDKRTKGIRGKLSKIKKKLTGSTDE